MSPRKVTVVRKENLVRVGVGGRKRKKGSLFYILIKLCDLILYNS